IKSLTISKSTVVETMSSGRFPPKP
ncbi:hypothetical protein VCHENC02_3384B, partial [Vibrio harveyi]